MTLRPALLRLLGAAACAGGADPAGPDHYLRYVLSARPIGSIVSGARSAD